MDDTLRPRRALHSAITHLLRPLVRLLLRHAIPFATFEELAKKVYVEVAMRDFALPGRKPSISRASILTGLTRKDVQRLVAEPPEDGSGVDEKYNRAARVLTGWIRDPDFLDRSGRPRPLALDGPLGFADLVRRHSGDMPARAVLDELLRVDAVQRDDAGRYAPVTRAYVPQRSLLDKLAILGTDVADLIATIDHNLEHGAEDPRFQRKVMYHRMPAHVLPAFRKLSAEQSQALLERLDAWLSAHDTDDASAPGPHARVGVGIHYFEEGTP